MNNPHATDRNGTAAHAEAVNLLAPHWPTQGGRHRAYRALAGGLLRAGVPQADAEALVEALAEATRDEEAPRRVQSVAGTAAALQAGKPVTGWPALARDLGEGGADAVARFRRALGLTISLADLAAHKRLPVAFLQSLGLEDLPGGGVGVPYRDAGGRTAAVKQRTALQAKDGSKWPSGVPLLAYGEDRLGEAAGELVLVEGESDCWTLWHHGLSALGLPGADTVRKTLHAGHVGGVGRVYFRTIYVVQESDAGGEAFIRNVIDRLAELNWRGTLKVIRLPGAKDPSELHCRAPAEFKAAWRAALGAAAPAPAGGPGAARPKRPLRLPDPYRPFPVHALPEPLRGFAAAGAAALGCDPCYLALPALAVASGLVGNTRTIRLKRDWSEPSVLWAAIVGDSGTLKSPALKLVVGPVYRLQKELIARFKQELKDYQKAREEYDRRARQAKRKDKPFDEERPEPPRLTRVITGDVTIEKLAELLEDNPRGLLLCRDELGGWLTSFQRYKGKAGGSDLPGWLEMFRAETLVVDRKTGDRPTLFIPHAAVSVCGGIQPGTLARALTPEYFEAGMAARFLMGMPPKQPKRLTEAEVDPDTRQAYERALRRLLDLQLDRDDQGEAARFALKLTPDAKAAWVAFYSRWASRQAGADGEAAACLSKLEGCAARFALLHHVVGRVAARTGSEECDECDPVERPSVEAGAELADWFAYEAARIYATVRESDQEREARRLVEFIRCHGGRMTARRLRLSNVSRYRSPEDAEAALRRLADAGLSEWAEVPPGPKGGRPSRALSLKDDATCFKTSETPEGGEDGEDEGGPRRLRNPQRNPRPPTKTSRKTTVPKVLKYVARRPKRRTPPPTGPATRNATGGVR
jgi:hypothetical protein